MHTPKASFKTLCATLALAALTLCAPEVQAQNTVTEKATPSPTPEKTSSSEQMPLPENVPAVAPEYTAPNKPLPPVVRVGVDGGEPLPLSLNEAIRMALENNNDIDASRIDVEKGEYDLTAARGAYDPRYSKPQFVIRASIFGLAVYPNCGNPNRKIVADLLERILRTEPHSASFVLRDAFLSKEFFKELFGRLAGVPLHAFQAALDALNGLHPFLCIQ